ncbi:MAG: type II toxin-antitoxin system RelE/ParE family toxin [bacterium]|nr:type II toxin-antitoxin system RelE/ParE family toxin [bacterium]
MKIFYTSRARKEVRKLERELSQRIHADIGLLAKNPYPHGSQKLEDEEGYRIRIGNYRVIYVVDKKNKEITIMRIRHRKEAYKRF